MQRILHDGTGYLGNIQVKRDGIQHQFTAHEISEYKKCAADPVYFAKTYCKIINLDRGLIPFDLYPYQGKMFANFTANRYNIVLACRQSGKSASVCIWLLWYALFHSDKTIAVLANKGATAREMLSRITLALENIPFFLQPGCKVLNKGTIKFSNNSTIFAAATTGSSIRGRSVDVLYIDECAFVENADEFYTSTYPVITSGKSTKVIITSTMNGIGNLFYRLWEGAVQKTNEYVPFRVDWWDVPGRDEAWKIQTIANTSQMQFDQEFGNRALGTSSSLIAVDSLLSLTAENPLRLVGGYGGVGTVKVYREPVEGHKYIMLVDVSKGRGQDYSTFTIIDVTARPYEQVATYRDNMISPLLLPDILVNIATKYNKAMLVIESNDHGVVVCNAVYYELEYENTFVESAIKHGGVGVTMTSRVKRIGCSNLKDFVEARKLIVRDINTIQELSTFESKGGSYSAADGCHDDMVMNLVLFAWFVSTPFAELGEGELKDMLFAEKVKQMESELLPPIIFNTGYEDNPASSYHYEDMIEEQRRWNTL